jgi:hypothetical protein
LRKKGGARNQDSGIFAADPRSLDVIRQIIYTITCFESGLSEKEIIYLYMNDKASATVIIDLVLKSNLIRRDISSGEWKRTDKGRRLMDAYFLNDE